LLQYGALNLPELPRSNLIDERCLLVICAHVGEIDLRSPSSATDNGAMNPEIAQAIELIEELTERTNKENAALREMFERMTADNLRLNQILERLQQIATDEPQER
jgi:hypothetical protein